MKQRGKESVAAMTVLPDLAAPIQRVPRPTPPHDLTDEEVEVWVSVINGEEADHFSPATLPLLAEYCRHTVDARKISALIEKHMARDATLEQFDRLLKMRQRTSTELGRLAKTMRLAQQTMRNDRGNVKKPAALKLWD